MGNDSELAKYPDVSKSVELKKALINALNNYPNDNVRSLSALSLVEGFGAIAKPEIEQLLVKRLGSEGKKAEVAKDGIVTGLLMLAYKPNFLEPSFTSTATMPAIFKAVEDPLPLVSAKAVGIIARMTPVDGLPVLMKRLKTAKNNFLFEQILGATVAYGKAASPYIPDLEGVAAAESEEDIRKQIQSAIETIKASSPPQ